MFLIALLIFIAVFAVVALIVSALGAGASHKEKQIVERLESISAAAERRPEEEGISILREELLSSIPWVNRLLFRISIFPQAAVLLRQANVSWSVTGLTLNCLGAGILGGVVAYWRTGALPFALLIGAAAASIPVVYVYFKRSQRFNQFEEKMPEALDLMVGALRAGHSLVSALEMVGKEMPEPLGGEFRKCFDEQNYGLELRDALINMGQRVPIHDVQIAITAILIQKESGGNLAEILEKAAAVIRDRFRLKRQIRVHTAQGRLTGIILALLPVFLGLALYALNPEYMSRLWQDKIGLKLMYAAIGMEIIGGLIIRKIVRIRV
jgi:tight adherence protein B